MTDPASSRPPIDPKAIRVPTGLRDLYPADLNRLRFIQDAWRTTSINFGFDEIDGPTFEDADLYAVKSGQGILNEVFGVFSGKDPKERASLAAGGDAPYALRPEFTPTLARMYAAKAGALPKPTKWFWTQNCFRAERPQRGRLREFYQWNCDIIGDHPPFADAEAIATCIALLQSLGLTSQDVRVKIGDRGVVEQLLMTAGCDYYRVADGVRFVDGRSKLSPAEQARIANELEIDLTAYDEFVAAASKLTPALLGSGNEGQMSVDIHQSGISASVENEVFYTLLKLLGEAGVADWCDIDFSIARGLAYYTGMVFEVHEASGAERAIAGGGRYDGLIELFGGPPTPAVGFGMGDVVLSLVLQDRGLMPSDEVISERLGQRPDVFVISNGTPEADAKIEPVLAACRKATPSAPGLHARRSYKTTKNVGKLLQDASKAAARCALIIESGTAGQLKNLDTQVQRPVLLAGVERAVRAELLAARSAHNAAGQ
jgi:histidyl-tRNA synthetase